MPKADRAKLFAFFAVLFLVACFSLRQADKAQKASFRMPFAFSQEAPPKLSRFSLVGALAGLRAVAADWIYIDLLQYYGDNKNRLDGRYQKLYGLVRELLWLDPSFHFGIQYGTAILGWNVERPQEAVDILRRAVRMDPGYARYQWYLAALSYSHGDEVQGTLPLLEELVQQPDRSDVLLRILGNLYIKHGMWDKAEAYWKWVARVSNQPLTRKKVQEALEKIKAGRKAGKVEG